MYQDCTVARTGHDFPQGVGSEQASTTATPMSETRIPNLMDRFLRHEDISHPFSSATSPQTGPAREPVSRR